MIARCNYMVLTKLLHCYNHRASMMPSLPPSHMSASHTPGPWTIEPFCFSGIPQGHQIIGVRNGTGTDTYLAVVHCGTRQVLQAEGEANARLMARSPYLLAMLKEAVVDAGQRLTMEERKARAQFYTNAIAKAEGSPNAR